MAVRLKSVKNIDQLYGSLVSEWTLEHDVVIGASQNYFTKLESEEVARDFQSPENRMMIWDSLTYLPDDILHKVDRAAMAVSLETRVRFLTRCCANSSYTVDMKVA